MPHDFGGSGTTRGLGSLGISVSVPENALAFVRLFRLVARGGLEERLLRLLQLRRRSRAIGCVPRPALTFSSRRVALRAEEGLLGVDERRPSFFTLGALLTGTGAGAAALLVVA